MLRSPAAAVEPTIDEAETPTKVSSYRHAGQTVLIAPLYSKHITVIQTALPALGALSLAHPRLRLQNYQNRLR